MSTDAGHSDLGRYRLGRLLGRGGMGEVYLAHDLALDRDVAIKFVAPASVGDEAATRRQLHEARAAAVLDHPCICTVHETGQTPDGKSYIVMQYVEGEPLSAVLRHGPLGVRDALCAQIADALGGAHRHACVHVAGADPAAAARREERPFYKIRHSGWKTNVTTGSGVEAVDPKVIRYPGGDGEFVTKVWVQSPGSGGPWTCTFSDTNQFKELCLCQDPNECKALCN